MMLRQSNRKTLHVVFRWCATVICGALLSAASAEQVTLQLRNGDRLTGEFVSMSTTNVVITNGLLGRLSVPVGYVDRLEKKAITNLAATATHAPQQTPVPSASASPAPPPSTHQVVTPTPPPAAAASTASTNAPTVTAAAKPPAAPVGSAAPKAKPPKHWILDAQFGTDLEFNQTQRELFFGRVKWTYGLDRFRTIVDYLANYGINAGVVSANDMAGTARVELDLTKAKKLYLYNAVGLGYNEIRKIDFGLNESVGVGYKFITLTNFVYSMDLGLNYQRQLLSDDTVKNFAGIRVGEHATWSINAKWTLDEKIDCLPQFSGTEDLQARLEVNLRYLLLSNLTLNFTVINFYDTHPAPGVSNNDLLLRGTIGVKF